MMKLIFDSGKTHYKWGNPIKAKVFILMDRKRKHQVVKNGSSSFNTEKSKDRGLNEQVFFSADRQW